MANTIIYRPEIDGMRAVSVMSVLFFHAGFTGFTGGYVGVDVFFVISGYLITSIILKARTEQKFSMINFWERRARRILPALLLLLCSSSIYAWFFLKPIYLMEFSEQLLAALFFVANFWMSGAVDYFSPSAANSPLSHLWSLAVEEQFYLLFPIFLVIALRTGRTFSFVALALLVVMSLSLAQWSGNLKTQSPFIESNLLWYAPSVFSDFYLPTGRVWELLVGALLAFIPPKAIRYPMLVQDFLAVFGLMMITLAVVNFNKETVTPSFFTLLPVIGAALIILNSNNKGVANFILSRKPIVFLGMISYSLYLIHQSVFAFVRHSDPYFRPVGEVLYLGLWKSLGIILLCIGLSYLSWRYVEQPFRRADTIKFRSFLLWVSVVSVFCVAVGIASKITGGPMLLMASPQDRYFLTLDERELGAYVGETFARSKHGVFDLTTKTSKVLIIGDSHGQDFANVVAESKWLPNRQLKTIPLDNACTKYFSAPSKDITDENFWIPDFRREICEKSIKRLKSNVNLKAADIIFIAQEWTTNGAGAVQDLLNEIEEHQTKPQEILVVGKKSFGIIVPESFRQTPMDSLLENTYKPKLMELQIDRRIKKNAKQKHISIFKHICSERLECPIFTPEGKLISYDGGHLTKDGAIFIGKKLFSLPRFKKMEMEFLEVTQ